MKKTILLLYLLFFCILSSNLVFAQQRTGSIHGRILTSDGSPAGYVSVGLKEVPGGSISEANGNYRLNRIKAGSYTLRVSAVGLEAQEKPITVSAGQSLTVNFTLQESAARLKEVIVETSKPNRFAKTESSFVAKIPLKSIENPQVYSVITKELLNEQLVFTADDAVRNTPGIQKMWEATGRGGDGGSYFNSRGFILQSQLRNGIAGIVTSTIDAANLERLEVIKGPSATLFGSSLTSYGGLLNRVTKKPYENFGGEIAVSGGNYDFNRVSADINTPLDAAKKILFRVNSAYHYEGSFQNNTFNRSLAVAPSLVYQPTDRLSVHLDAEMFYGWNSGKQILFFYYPAAALGATRADQLQVDYTNSYRGGGLTQKTRSTNFFGQVNYKISEHFTSSTNFTSSHSFSDGFGPYFYLVPDNVVTQNEADTGKANYIARADQSTGNSKSQVLEVQQNFNGDFEMGSLRNRIVVGLDFFHTNSDQNFFGSNLDIVPLNVPDYDYSSFNGTTMAAKYAAGPPDFTYPVINKTNTYSAFASDVLNLTDNFSVLAALRVDHYVNKGDHTGGTITEGYEQTALSPKFGIVYQPVKDKVALFANYQNSFNNQGTFNAYNPTDPSKGLAAMAELEQANQIEGGVKLDLLAGKLSSTINYYNIQVKNILRTDQRAPAVAQIQDGTQLSKGVEIEVIANPFVGFNAVAGFSFNDSKYEKADADVNGRRPTTASSPYLANLWLSYRLPETILKGLGLGFGGNYASDNKIMNSVSMGEFTLPAYTILGATAFYEQPKYRLGLKVDNLTNEHYWIGYTTMNPQKLRTIVGSVAYKF
ncbi:TonB-dependent siderophore receptor [Adhaeribacter arboris]|uniref:TonB-dependent siderophore receptor n=1 Tax=Adhaeribacter arboris TaxID=2072846 RepID=A0A2T2YC47_9BACT|nr:TonB-dependent receptor [Adhaeribacter arboris]PSR53095.1 TonB-dependent siderophore receptor [Adhaeribacter arboris]